MEQEKIVEIDVSLDSYVSSYLSLFYDALGLTDTEEKVLEKIVHSYIELKDKVAEPYLTELVLSTERRKILASDVNISSADLNNRIKKLRDKNIFISLNPLVIDPLLIPSKEITFVFNTLTKVETLKSDPYLKEEVNEEVVIIEDDLIKKVKPIN